MNWKEIAKTRLKEYTLREKAVELLQMQISEREKRLSQNRRCIIESSEINKAVSRALTDVVLLKELKNNLDIAYKEKKSTEKGLKHLTEEERKILKSLYIDRDVHNIEKLGELMGFCKTRMYEKVNEALYNFAVASYSIKIK